MFHNSRCYKILDILLKLDSTVFDYFNIDLIRVEAIRELSNAAFDHFRLGFDSSSLKKNVLFHPIPHQIFRRQCFRSVSEVRR